MSSNIKNYCNASGTLGHPPPVLPRWFSSGGWQIGGIMNSGMLGECGCKHMPSLCSSDFCMPATALAVRLSSSSSPAVPGMVKRKKKLLHRNSSSEYGKTNRFKNFFSCTGPRWLYNLSVILVAFLFSNASLLINPSPSRSGFDAADGRAVPILSPDAPKVGYSHCDEHYKSFGEAPWAPTAQSPHRQFSDLWRYPCNKNKMH